MGKKEEGVAPSLNGDERERLASPWGYYANGGCGLKLHEISWFWQAHGQIIRVS
jgi:hypothetical protein